jgi:hypothetical protein
MNPMRNTPLFLTLMMALPLVALAPAASAVELESSIANVAPAVVSISLAGLTSGTLVPVAGGTATLTATVVASDANGFNDITSVTVGIIKPDGTSVHVAQGAGTFTGSGGGGLQSTYTRTLTMNYYDAAALTTTTYKIKAVATDVGGLTGTNALTLATFNYGQLVALNAPASVALGGSGVNPGAAGSVMSVSIQNYGNQQMDTQVSGTALTFSGNTIPVGSIAYSLSSDMSGSTALTGSAATLSSFDLASGSSSARTTYFQLTAPTGLPPGSYTGTLTVAAVAG